VISYNASATVVANPILIPVFFPSSPDQAATVSYLQELATSAQWNTLAQYGIGNATVGTPIYLSADPAASVTTAQIEAFVISSDTTWTPHPTGSEIYILYYPTSTTTITDLNGGSYHTSTTQATPVPYAVIPYQSLSADAYLQFETMEAASDPLGTGYNVTNQGYIQWLSLGRGTGLADMCTSTDSYYASALGQNIRSIWSNSNLAASLAPCFEPAGATQMFGGFPVMPTTYTDPYVIPNPAASNLDSAVEIAPGASVTVPVKLFSYGALPAVITVTAAQTNLNAGQTNLAIFSFDKTTGTNGDIVNLTITAPTTSLSTSSPGQAYITFYVSTSMTDSSATVHSGFSFPGLIFN
jgi:hypothetical protein